MRAAIGSIALQGFDPYSGIFYYAIILTGTLFTTLPYLADRLITTRLHGFVGTLVFPTTFTTLEYLGSFGLFGSLTSIANTQYGNLALMQVASVTGIWGITFLITWFSSIVNWAWQRDWTWSTIRRGALLYAAVLSLVLLGGGARLAIFPPEASEVRVAGLSAPAKAMAAVDQQLSMDTMMSLLSGKATAAQRTLAREAYATVADNLLARSEQEALAGAKIVVWSEVGVSVLEEDAPSLIQRATTLAKQESIYLDLGLGVILRHPAPSGPGIRDEAVLLDPTGKVVWTYEKTHLVPFAETGLLVHGKGKVPLVASPYGQLATMICFDLDFPIMIRQTGQAGADVVLAPSNDWQGIDPSHTEAAAFRAIEDGFTLVRQASNGLAMVVDYQGHVLTASDYFTTDQQTMVAYVPMHGVHTIYAAIGDLFAWLCALGFVALGGLAIWQSRSRRSAAGGPVPEPQATN